MSCLIAAACLIWPVAQARALELMMFTRPGCPYCQKFDRDVAPIYSRSAEGQRAPLVRWDIQAQRPAMKLREPVIYTPTFVVIDGNAEIGRITGYISDDMFWGMLGKILAAVPAPAGPAAQPAGIKP